MRLGLGLVVVVYDDAAYGAEVHHFGPARRRPVHRAVPRRRSRGDRPRLRCRWLTVRQPGDLAPLADWLTGPRDRPLVIDAKISSDGGSWWLHEAFRAH